MANLLVLPKEQFSSVDVVIKALNSGVLPCTGYCAVFSARMQQYYLLWPEEMKMPDPEAPTDFSGKYTDNFGESRVLTQQGEFGECDAGWKYKVIGETAAIVTEDPKGAGITGKFREAKLGMPRTIDWSNNITYEEASNLTTAPSMLAYPPQTPAPAPTPSAPAAPPKKKSSKKGDSKKGKTGCC
eukprot:CAMPEP_0169106520 /NCGR_PEP_ID=MMETSP1015-20121227/24385_1 /TAXON_ID=342587 /ORGANISM="Karlodinium micrum, Strain CCMP2283" /LENGTH=184 /DNA_ID=CAMNT_0009167975 /DNA_START=122 /DNA_END=676 /DNA_ORIENTATION=-